MLQIEKDRMADKSGDNAVYLSFDEVRILLYSLGYRSCEGVFMPEKQFTQQEVLTSMFDMARRGLLYIPEEDSRNYSSADDEKTGYLEEHGQKTGCGDEFRIRGDVRRMLDVMGNPSGTMIYRPGETLPEFSAEFYDGPEYFCYIVPDYVLVSERDWTRREQIRFRGMDMESFTVWKDAQEADALDRSLRDQEDVFRRQPVSAAAADTENPADSDNVPLPGGIL